MKATFQKRRAVYEDWNVALSVGTAQQMVLECISGVQPCSERQLFPETLAVILVVVIAVEIRRYQSFVLKICKDEVAGRMLSKCLSLFCKILLRADP